MTNKNRSTTADPSHSPCHQIKLKHLLTVLPSLLLVACGGNDKTTNNSALSMQAAPIAVSTGTLVIDSTSDYPDLSREFARPSFHLAPVAIDNPGDIDSQDNKSSAHLKPQLRAVSSDLNQFAKRGVSMGEMQTQMRQFQREQAAMLGGMPPPSPAPSFVATYTPAQIRAAYNLPALPSGTSYTATQAAQLGAGQTIYIVDAKHNPNIAAELAAFNQRFSLPTCTTKTIATNATLPLAKPSANACELSIVYNDANGNMVANAPAYDSGWATEIALDVQWAHATAPLARIIVIEAADPSLTNLVGGVKLANAMGAGIVSMSFGNNEGNWTGSVDSAFTATGMTYLAATGDGGAAVEWPSVSANVLAVGATSLNYNGSTRSETAWNKTGGGISAYVNLPSYQTSSVPGLVSTSRRNVADVSLNGDPSTGQYVATIPQGSSAASWVSAGGTSLSTPQWAGIIAVANATRLLAGKTVMGAPHATLYGQIGTQASTYASSFFDITSGSDGTCANCTAKQGYDTLTGLGTPNVTALLGVLANTTVAATAPSITAASINGLTGTALSFTVSATGANPLTYSLAGAPSGMAISTSGVVTWATPVLGSYSVTVTATDSKTALKAQAVYTVKISAPPPPSITGATINGKVGTALNFTISATSSNTLSYSMTGAPSGMTLNSSSGAVTWSTPVQGSYTIVASAKDSKTGLSSQANYVVVIAAAAPPSVTAASITTSVGSVLNFNLQYNATNPVSFSLTNAPSGMSISSTGAISWASAALGTWNVTAVVKDSKTGLSGQALITVVVAAKGPVITANPITGVNAKALQASITITDPTAMAISISMSGLPLGMMVSLNGTALNLNWASPVTGNYTLKITVTDNNGYSTTASVPVTIAAK